jgi:Protein of unknown function (DUF2950)
MRTENLRVRTFSSRFAGMVVMAVFPMLLAGWARPGFAQTSATRTFSSAGEACKALFQAAQKSDERELEAILGSEKQVISSGDEIEDKLEREQFSQKYQEMHRLVREADGNTVLYIGAENWPFPIPLVSANGAWHFDSDAGKNEILFRTIGENEATAILVCDDFASARKQHNASKSADDPVAGYAQSLISLTNSSASQTTSGVPEKTSHLFHGYNFQAGKDTARVPLIAYPAKYRSSGVMTFLVTKSGVVYEKDLGPDTNTVAQKIRGDLLDSSWHRAE